MAKTDVVELANGEFNIVVELVAGVAVLDEDAVSELFCDALAVAINREAVELGDMLWDIEGVVESEAATVLEALRVRVIVAEAETDTDPETLND